MVGAHNGNVVNNVELRAEFVAEGMTVRSDNDGETCVHAVERHVRRGHELVAAIRLAYEDLQGDYAFVIGSAGRMTAVRVQEGLGTGSWDRRRLHLRVVGPAVHLPLTRRVVRPLDGEVVTLWADRVEVRLGSADGSLVDRPAELVTESMDAVRKGGYAHFMEKEIHEQPQVARELLHAARPSPGRGARGRGDAPCQAPLPGRLRHELPRRPGRSVFLAQLAGPRPRSRCSHRSSIAQYAPAVGPGGRSASRQPVGETKDVLNALEAARGAAMTSFGLAKVSAPR